MEEDFDHGDRVTAVFEPKKMDTLRLCMVPLIGRSFEFEFIGISDDDEPYAGQSRWWISRKHDPELPDECKGRWMPREDIRIVGADDSSPPRG